MRLTKSNLPCMFNLYDIVFIEDVPFRIIGIKNAPVPSFVLVELETEIIHIIEYDNDRLISLYKEGRVRAGIDEDTYMMPDLKEGDKRITDLRYERVKKAARSIYPDYAVLNRGGIGNGVIPSLSEEIGLSGRNTRKYMLRFLQYGEAYISCVDRRLIPHTPDENGIIGGKVRGRKRNGKDNTAKIDDELISAFRDAYNDYLHQLNRYQYGKDTENKPSLKGCYQTMLSIRYVRQDPLTGKKAIVPENERPSYRRFYHWVMKNGTHGVKIRKMAGEMDMNNNSRILTGDVSSGIVHPGELVEIDAHELPVYLRSSRTDKSGQVVGKGVLYIAIDVLTRRVVGMHVHVYVNNSYEGFLNLVDSMLMTDEENARMNMAACSSAPVFPGPMIPDEIRTDQGAEYTSKALKENLTGGEKKYSLEGVPVTVNLARPGTGSMKGLVERIFGNIDSDIRDALGGGSGIVKKTSRSRHQKEAALSIFDVRQMIYAIISAHNNEPVINYPVTPGMSAIRADWSPNALWDHFAGIYGTGIDCTDEGMRNAVRYGLMKKDKVFRLSQKQISYKDFLYYDLGDDTELMRRARIMASEKKSEMIEVRYDPRSVDRIYRNCEDGSIRIYHLAAKRRNLRSFEDMGWAEFDVWIKEIKHQQYEQRLQKDDAAAMRKAEFRDIADESAKAKGAVSGPVSMKEIRKEAIAERNALTAYDQKKRDDIFGIKKPETLEAAEEKQPVPAVMIEEKKEKEPAPTLPDVAPDDFDVIFAAYGMGEDD